MLSIILCRMSIHAYIASTGCYVPDYVLTNAEIATMVDTSDEWITDRCGVKERRILKNQEQATAFMAKMAAEKAISKAKVNVKEIEVVIVSTATPEHQFPATSGIVAEMLGIKNAWCFDCMAACSGFLFALNVASKLIESGTYKTILLIGSDKMSSIMDFTNRNTCVLFGDGAGAVVLKATESGNGIQKSVLKTDGSGYKNLYQKAGGSLFPATQESVLNKEHSISMSGQTVFKTAVTKISESCIELLEQSGLSKNEIDYLIPHQANKRIIHSVIELLELPPEKVSVNIDKYGNTTCASIPICLDEWSSKFKTGDNIVICAFGAGFSWGSLYLKWYNPN